MHVHWYDANANIAWKGNKKGKKERRGKGQTTLLCLHSVFPDFASLAFHISPRKPDSAGCANEDLGVLLPSYRAIAGAPVIWRTLKRRYRGTYANALYKMREDNQKKCQDEKKKEWASEQERHRLHTKRILISVFLGEIHWIHCGDTSVEDTPSSEKRIKRIDISSHRIVITAYNAYC